MKLIIYIFAVSFILVGCKKETETELTRTQLLCGTDFKKWKVTGYQRSLNSPVTNTTPDVLSSIYATSRDDRMIFYTNGTQKLNHGLLAPAGDTPNGDYTTANWVFTNNETVINCTVLFGIFGGNAQLNLSIKEITEQKIVLDNEFINGGITYYTRWVIEPAN
jgi:hypothetical protein